MNAYLFFLGAHRDQVSKENPGKSAQELLALTAELWQTVSPEEKAKFQKEADADLARCASERARGGCGSAFKWRMRIRSTRGVVASDSSID